MYCHITALNYVDRNEVFMSKRERTHKHCEKKRNEGKITVKNRSSEKWFMITINSLLRFRVLNLHQWNPHWIEQVSSNSKLENIVNLLLFKNIWFVF